MWVVGQSDGSCTSCSNSMLTKFGVGKVLCVLVPGLIKFLCMQDV